MLNADKVKLGTALLAVALWVALVVFKVQGADDLIMACKTYLVSLGAYHLKTSQGDISPPAQTGSNSP